MSVRPTGHIRERSPGSWELRYSLGRDPATGKRRIATATVRGKLRDAEKELRRLLRTLDLNEHVEPGHMTVRDWLTAWLGAIRQEVSPKTLERYGEIVRNFLVAELGALPIAKLAPAHISAAYTRWATEGRRDGKPGGLSPQTRRHIHRILKAALGRAVEQRVIARYPADVLARHLPKVEHRQMLTLTAEEAVRLLEAIKHKRVYWPTLIALATGMRRGEILALRCKNIDLDRGLVRVVESLEQTKTILRFKAPKTEKSRAIALPSFVVEELRRLKWQQAEELLALGLRQSGETPACGRQDGEAMPPRSLTHEFAKAASRVKNLPRVRFHDLPHSHATQLLSAGVHPKVAQERLGHSTITTTLDLYSHVSETMQGEAAAKLDTAFRSAISAGACIK
jgi:integrase